VSLDQESKTATVERHFQTILAFLTEIGISWRAGTVSGNSFLPGLEVVAGELVIDRAQLKYPGDLLHEAGHIALLPATKRSAFSGNVKESLPGHEGDELAVILWSYAASRHLGLPINFVIHDAGYQQQAGWLRDQLSQGIFIGLPLLVWMGLTTDSRIPGQRGFPQMERWLR